VGVEDIFVKSADHFNFITHRWNASMRYDDPEDLRSLLTALPITHFEPLFTLLPSLRPPKPEQPQPPEETFSDRQTDPVSDLISLCWKLDIWVPLDWSTFSKEQPFHRDHSLIDRFDRFHCLFAITALFRADRYTDGVLDRAWMNGTLHRLVARIKELG
jgi:hypothetical protein